MNFGKDQTATRCRTRSLTRWSVARFLARPSPWRLVGVALIAAACGRQVTPEPLPDVDLAAREPSVQRAVREARARFDAIVAGHPSDRALGDAYGELAMTYQAQDLLPPAAVAYANARRLSPHDKRWPYLQGHLYGDAARLAEAVASFQAAYRIDERDPAILQSLGAACLAIGRLDCARSMFERLHAEAPSRAAAAAGLGKTALAARDYQTAIAHLEEALRLSPASSRLRQPLAAAYRAAGEPEKADAALRGYTVDGGEPQVEDPAVDALAAKVAVSRVLLRRGQRAAKAGRFDDAEKAFRATIAADPDHAEAYVNLGITLANLNRDDEARRFLEQALRVDGSIALAHLSLAVVHDRHGRLDAAIESYRNALQHDPGLVQARVYLADALMRHGDPVDAAAAYRQALQNPQAEAAGIRQALAMACVKAGHWGEAREALEHALTAEPENPSVANALARVLATAPDARVRDAARALQMARRLFEQARVPETGETYAMALAGSGRYAEAEKLQRETIVVADRRGGGAPDAFRADNLARYQRGQPARAGWPDDDPVFRPRRGAVATGSS